MILISVALVYIQRSLTPVALLWIYSSRVLLSLGPLCQKKPIQWLIKSHHPFHLCVFDPWKMSGGDSLAVVQMVESFPWLRSLFFLSVPFLVFPCWHTLHTRAFLFVQHQVVSALLSFKSSEFFPLAICFSGSCEMAGYFQRGGGSQSYYCLPECPSQWLHTALPVALSPLFSLYPVPVPEGPCRGAEGIHEPWTLRYFAFWRTQLGKISQQADLEVTLFHADHLTMQISRQLIQT